MLRQPAFHLLQKLVHGLSGIMRHMATALIAYTPYGSSSPAPMAILLDARQAYKPECPSPCANPDAASSLKPEPLASVPLPSHSSSGTVATAQCNLPLRTSTATITPRTRNHSGHGRLVLSGRMADVCAELEQLVLQEERYLRAG